MHLSSHGNHKSAGLPSQTGKHSARQANEDTKPVPHVAGVPETISEDVEGKACPSFHAGRRNKKSWGGHLFPAWRLMSPSSLPLIE